MTSPLPYRTYIDADALSVALAYYADPLGVVIGYRDFGSPSQSPPADAQADDDA